MAGSTLAYPLNGAANWEAFPDIVQKIQAGYMRLGLTNFGNNNEPEIAAGGTLDVNGACCVFSAAESITGWAGIAISTDVYIKVVVTGAVVTAEFTTDAPTWDSAKQGWYDGNDRYIGGLYKDASGNYALKWLYSPLDSWEMLAAGATRPIRRKILPIGDWNMNISVAGTSSVTITHGLPFEKIRSVGVCIRNDDNTLASWPTASQNQTAGNVNVKVSWSAATVRLGVTTPSVYDSTEYDATSFNRGWITIEYES